MLIDKEFIIVTFPTSFSSCFLPCKANPIVVPSFPARFFCYVLLSYCGPAPFNSRSLSLCESLILSLLLPFVLGEAFWLSVCDFLCFLPEKCCPFFLPCMFFLSLSLKELNSSCRKISCELVLRNECYFNLHYLHDNAVCAWEGP